MSPSWHCQVLENAAVRFPPSCVVRSRLARQLLLDMVIRSCSFFKDRESGQASRLECPFGLLLEETPPDLAKVEAFRHE